MFDVLLAQPLSCSAANAQICSAQNCGLILRTLPISPNSGRNFGIRVESEMRRLDGAVSKAVQKRDEFVTRGESGQAAIQKPSPASGAGAKQSKAVSSILGHANVGITLNTYTHPAIKDFAGPLNARAAQFIK
jgi:hypothetical protein